MLHVVGSIVARGSGNGKRSLISVLPWCDVLSWWGFCCFVLRVIHAELMLLAIYVRVVVVVVVGACLVDLRKGFWGPWMLQAFVSFSWCLVVSGVGTRCSCCVWSCSFLAFQVHSYPISLETTLFTLFDCMCYFGMRFYCDGLGIFHIRFKLSCGYERCLLRRVA